MEIYLKVIASVLVMFLGSFALGFGLKFIRGAILGNEFAFEEPRERLVLFVMGVIEICCGLLLLGLIYVLRRYI